MSADLSRYYKTFPPRAHQVRAFEAAKDREAVAFFMEPRLGKSLVTLMNAAYLYEGRRIDALGVSAPAGVHRNWVLEEIPKHLPEWTNHRCYAARSGFARTKAAEKEREDLLAHPGLIVFAVNTEAFIVEDLREWLGKFFRRRQVMWAFDESADFASPGSRRKRIAWNIRKKVPYRRILDGTPAAESPLDLYGQLGCLADRPAGFDDYLAFSHHFAEWEEKVNGKTEQEYKVLKNYKNLDELYACVDGTGVRVTRASCTDMKDPVYARRLFELAGAQRRAYDRLREEFVAELRTGRLTAAHVLTRMTRLQQISSGFAVLDRELDSCPSCAGETEDCAACGGYGFLAAPQKVEHFPDNPRLDAFLREAERVKGQFVVWAKFTPDVDAVMAALEKAGITAARFDGTIPVDVREAAKRDFQAGLRQAFVSKPRAGGRGQMLAAADVSIFYSHEHSLRLRLQAQDRVEDLAKTAANDVLDLVADDTLDAGILLSYKGKRSLSELVMGDDPRPFL